MGRDKAGLVVHGVPFATRLASLLSLLVEDVVLVGGDPPAEAPGRRVSDPPGPACALRGLVGALLGMAFGGFQCEACGKIPKSEFPPEVQSKMTGGTMGLVGGAVVLLVVVIGILVAIN